MYIRIYIIHEIIGTHVTRSIWIYVHWCISTRANNSQTLVFLSLGHEDHHLQWWVNNGLF